MKRRSFSMHRMLAIFIKEFQQMLRDRLTFAMAVGVPIIQLVLFGYAINTDPKGLPTVLPGKLPQARATANCVSVGPPGLIAKGSAAVLVGKLPAARIGDTCGHGGSVVKGFPAVLIGG